MSSAEPTDDPGEGPVLVVDFGAQYAQLIARRVREAHVYSEIVPHTATAAELAARRPSGIILSGGPKSVNEDPAPSIDPAVYDLGIPILGICYGAQLLFRQLGGEVSRTGRGEYGRTPLTVTGSSPILVDWPESAQVWMSHGDAMTRVPEGFVATATSPDAPVAALHDPDRGIFGVQFHPEVVHTEHGRELLERFLYDICHCPPLWTHSSIIESQVAAVRAQVGGSRVLCALSGGVDSAVAAALVHKAIGDQLTCVFVDTGLMRAGEAEQVAAVLGVDDLGVELHAEDPPVGIVEGGHRGVRAAGSGHEALGGPGDGVAVAHPHLGRLGPVAEDRRRPGDGQRGPPVLAPAGAGHLAPQLESQELGAVADAQDQDP